MTFEFRNLATGDVLVPCSGSNLRSKVCSPMIYTLGRVELAANVFLCLLILAQFTLFVYSCVAAHRHRIARRQARRSRGVVGGDADTELAVSPRSSDPSRFAGHLAKAPPAYTVSAVGGQHAGSPHPIAPSFVRSDVVSGDGTAKERAEGSGFPSPSLGPPVSPVNSGSGGGFGDSHHHSWGRNSGHGAQGPFGDENAIKYQGR